jgi:hypothetical protein
LSFERLADEIENMSLGIAFRAFFAALLNRATADRIRAALQSPSADPGKLDESSRSAANKSSQAAASDRQQPGAQSIGKSIPARSEALTLLSTLQREARLVDLICEPLEQFTDSQIGAAAREVLRDSRQTLDRLFAISPLAEQSEGDSIDLSAGQSPSRVRRVGKSQGTSGVVVHRGWQATKCELPEWQGDRRDALILAPTEVEVS